MFEIGRGLKRWFTAPELKDGLAAGDPGLLELLDLRLLRAEARSASVAAGRIGAKDRPQRLVEAARDRRSGGPARRVASGRPRAPYANRRPAPCWARTSMARTA